MAVFETSWYPRTSDTCAVSAGSDRRQPRHERRHPVSSRRRRQDRCARISPNCRQKCHSAPPTPPIGPQSSGSARRWPSFEDESHVERFRATLNGLGGFHMGNLGFVPYMLWSLGFGDRPTDNDQLKPTNTPIGCPSNRFRLSRLCVPASHSYLQLPRTQHSFNNAPRQELDGTHRALTIVYGGRSCH